MRQDGIQARRRKRFCLTTNSAHTQQVAQNLVERNFETTAPNQVWAGDVTYLPTREGWFFLAVLIDLYSRRVVGWATSDSNDERLTIAALEMAVEQRRPARGLIHHSDRGTTYASGGYQERLLRYGMSCSMSRKGDCWDNAVVESFFSTLKTEALAEHPCPSRHHTRRIIFEYIEAFYNSRRRHSRLDYISPIAFETGRDTRLRRAA